jgi:hypothetical protein
MASMHGVNLSASLASFPGSPALRDRSPVYSLQLNSQKDVMQISGKAACFAASLAVFSLSACGGGDAEDSRIVQFEVADYKSPCAGVGLYMCSRVRISGAGTYGLFYDNIAGFAQQWGRRYVIEVRETRVSNPPADSSGKSYALMRVISETAALDDASFSINTLAVPSAANGYVRLSTAGGTLLDGTLFTCATTQVCTDVAALVQRNEVMALTFSYSAGASLPLVMTAAVKI